MTEKIFNESRFVNGIRTEPEYAFEFSFEKEFEIHDAMAWIGSRWTDSIYWCYAYILCIFGGQVSNDLYSTWFKR